MIRSISQARLLPASLLGNGGPAFQDKPKHLVHEVIAWRALHDLIGAHWSLLTTI